MHEMQKLEANLEKSGIHSLEDLYKKRDDLIQVHTLDNKNRTRTFLN